MKNLSYPMIVVVAGLLIASAGSAKAGGSDGCCSGSSCKPSVAASPKLQATLEERCVSKCAAPETAASIATSQALANGSPRTQLQQQKSVATTGFDSPTTTFRTTGDDGVAASPKLRATLDERRQPVQIAPLK